MRVKIEKLEAFIQELLVGMGISLSHSQKIAQVYKRATLRGVGHHDIYDLPKKLWALDQGLINPKPNIKLQTGYQAMENYDGDNGMGELCCSFIMERAQQLADSYGIGFCSVANSNHFLSAAPYVEKAAEEGYFSIIWTSGKPAMGWPGTEGKIIGNNPMGFGTPSKNSPIFLDVSMAYSSIGNLVAKQKGNEKIPSYTAVDSNGNYTDDPAEALKGASLPIGGHKGFGLALMGELLTTIMSGGVMIEKKAEADLFGFGHHIYDQMAIVIKTDVFMPIEKYKERVSGLEDFIKSKDSNIRMPGERSIATKIELEQNGVLLDEDLIEKMNEWGEKYGVANRI